MTSNTPIYQNPDARNWRAGHTPDAVDFHRSMPGYEPSRLVEVPALASSLGVGRIFVKEESARFGLPAFKILGASYAISRALSERAGVSERALPVTELRDALSSHGAVRLVAATDGNHGRAVAHTARVLGQPATIYLPSDISAAAKDGIAAEDAEIVEMDEPYDTVVEHAAAATAGTGALLVQDTAWEGYEQIPQWIVDGYSTLFTEADTQLAGAGITAPDLVAVPVGVGSFAQAAVCHFRSGSRSGKAPSVLSVEPAAAPAVLTSLMADRLTSVPTERTIMAGLNCGTPSSVAWPILRSGIDAAVTVTDEAAAHAVHDLTAENVDAGPCGAAALAGVRAWQEVNPLSPNATIMLLSTESRRANALPKESK